MIPIDLTVLIRAITAIVNPTEIVRNKLARNETVIRLLRQFNLSPDSPPPDFSGVYAYTLVEYGVGKPQVVLELFRQPEIQQAFQDAWGQDNFSVLLKTGEQFLENATLGDELRASGIDARQEFYQFATVFIAIAKRTRTPGDILTAHQLNSLHRQIAQVQERLERLPSIEGIRTEMARLAAQSVLALPEASGAEQCGAFALAQQMRGWFETLGYRFEAYELWQTNAFEWIINIPVRRGRYDRILVRGIEGEAELRDVMTLRQSVEAQQTDEGWLVTSRRISRAARDAVEQPENRDLDCYTFDELVDLDADFTGYIEWLEAEIKRRKIDTRYVPLACTKEEIDPDTQQRLGVSQYDERDGWIDGYLDRWLDDPAKEHISILGEFGTGKTWVAFHYAWTALQRYQEAKERGVQRPRLPLVITLRDYAKALNVENVLAGFFFTQHNIRLNSEVFDQLNRMGKLLMIFDGFDEMAAKVDKQQMINNFWELAKVVVPGAKVVLTCRTEHFPDAQEGRALLNAELQASTASLTGETPQFEVLELEKFNDEQIRQVMSFQASEPTIEQVMSNPQLLDLARRPVMTELILEALPDIEAGKPVDMSRVYLYAVRRKMERDIKAERTFTSLADKLYFLCELSWEMLSSDRMSLNYREFPDRIRRLFGAVVQEEKDLDHWHYDMMGQTMLIRNAEGDYTPAHRSLLEFFVAYKFAAELGALAPDFLELAQMRSHLDLRGDQQDYSWSDYFRCSMDADSGTIPIPRLNRFVSEPMEILKSGFGQTPLTKAVETLLLKMLVPYNSAFEHPVIEVISETRNREESEVGYVGGNAATLAVALDKSCLVGRDLSNTILKNTNFSQAKIYYANLEGANLSGSTFAASFGSIRAVAFSPDGEILATSDSTGQIYLWNILNGRQVLSLKSQVGWRFPIAFHPNGDILATGSHNSAVKLWNIRNGQCFKELIGHEKWVRAVAFSSDGEILASGGEDATIKLWNIYTGECIRTLSQHTHWVHSIAFSPNRQILASGSQDKTIRLWDISTGQCIKILDEHADAVRSVAFSPNGQVLASGGDHKTLLWDVDAGCCTMKLSEHPCRVRSVAFSPDGRILATGGEDQIVRLWNVSTGECCRTLQGHKYNVSSLAFHPIQQLLATGSQDSTAKMWDIRTGECLKTFQGYSNWIWAIAFSSDDRMLASGSDDYAVRLWDISTGKCLKTLEGHENWIWTVTFNPIENLLASGSEDNTIRIWNVDTGECSLVLKEHHHRVRSVCFSPDGRLLASGSSDKTLKLWDVKSGKCLKTLIGHDEQVHGTAFSVDGRTLASSSSDKTIKLWDVSSGQCLKTLQSHNDWLVSVAFDSEGRFIASGGGDRTIKLWSVETGLCVKTLEGHTDAIQALMFAGNKSAVVSGSADHTVRVWDIETGECLILDGHNSSVWSIACSSDGQVVASSGQDEIIKLWDIKTGKCVKHLKPNRPYEGMNITRVKGLTETEKTTLKLLGAIEA